ncbi:MAG: tungstate ABC transporter permease WtpB [Bacteroidales bacterium]
MKRKHIPGIFELTLYLLSGLVLLFLAGPLAGMFIQTSLPELFDTGMDNEVQSSIVTTLLAAFSATIIFGLVGIPFAWFLARKQFWFKSLLLGIINLPVVIPHTAAGIALLGFVNRDSFFGRLADTAGISLVGNHTAIALAMAFVSAPFLLNAAYEGFRSVPTELEQAARILGATSFEVFYTVSLPLAARNILSGVVMMFARGMSEFGAVVIVAYHPMITPVLIYERFTAFGLAWARPVAVVFMLVTLVVFVVLRVIARKNNETR